MCCAARVNENAQSRILLNERSSRAGVIEMNVREQNRVQVGNVQPVARELFAKRAKGRPGTRVHSALNPSDRNRAEAIERGWPAQTRSRAAVRVTRRRIVAQRNERKQ